MVPENDFICIECHSAEEKAMAIHLLCNAKCVDEESVLKSCRPESYQEFKYVVTYQHYVTASSSEDYKAAAISIDEAMSLLGYGDPIIPIDMESMI